MKTLRTRKLFAVPAAILATWLVSAGASYGQYQVSQPGQPGPNAPAANQNQNQNQQDPANRAGDPEGPGRELYGNNNPYHNDRPYQSVPLPSEARIARERSGATPSELRVQADRVGPLAANGAYDYIPAMSPLQQALGVAPPVLWGPGWERPAWTDQQRQGTAAPAPAAGASQPRRHVDLQPSPLDVTPKPITMGRPVNAQVTQPLGPVIYQDTTINRPVVRSRGPATTQPATQPSLGTNFPTIPTTQPVDR